MFKVTISKINNTNTRVINNTRIRQTAVQRSIRQQDNQVTALRMALKNLKGTMSRDQSRSGSRILVFTHLRQV